MARVDDIQKRIAKIDADIAARFEFIQRGQAVDFNTETIKKLKAERASLVTERDGLEERARQKESKDKLDKIDAETRESTDKQKAILDRIAKEGILGEEGMQKILASQQEAIEQSRGARNRQLARSAQAFLQRSGGRLGPRSGASRNVVLNQALAPAVGGIVQQGSQDAAFRGDLERANEISKTLQPLQGFQFISQFLQNKFGQRSGRDLNLRGLAQGQSQFDTSQDFRERQFAFDQTRDQGGGIVGDLLGVVPDIFDLFSGGGTDDNSDSQNNQLPVDDPFAQGF